MKPSNRRRDAWRAILSARTDVDRLVAAAVGDYPDRTPVRPSGRGGTVPYGSSLQAPEPVPFQQATWGKGLDGTQPALAGGGTTAPADDAEPVDALREINEQERRALVELQQRAGRRLVTLSEELARALADEPMSATICQESMKALSIYLDERIMERLPDFMRSSWSRLQTHYTGSSNGGEGFYHAIDDLLAARSTPSFVFEVYYSCLANGFVGRYANSPQSIEVYQERLEPSITRPRVPTESTDTAEMRIGTSKPLPAWMVIAASLGFVVLVTASLTLLSNF